MCISQKADYYNIFRVMNTEKKKPRNIVVILGNGFDLDLGLPTSYKDFYNSKSYCPKDYPAPLIHHLNQCWPGRLEKVRWYDLENEFLNYYESILHSNASKDIITEEERDFLKSFNPNDLRKINEILNSEEASVLYSLIGKRIIKTDDKHQSYIIAHKKDLFKSPVDRDSRALRRIEAGLYLYLKKIDLRFPRKEESHAYDLLKAMQESYNEGNIVNVFTFNYTRVLMPNPYLRELPIHYVHGCWDPTIGGGHVIVGTRDNLDMAPEYDFLQKAMDHDFNPPDIVSALKYAEEIIIFGHSLGQNDRQYFAPFFKRQSSTTEDVTRKDITIFTRDIQSMNDIKRSLQNMTDGNLSTLYSINKINIIITHPFLREQPS